MSDLCIFRNSFMAWITVWVYRRWMVLAVCFNYIMKNSIILQLGIGHYIPLLEKPDLDYRSFFYGLLEKNRPHIKSNGQLYIFEICLSGS